jgi:hypothetical protein
MMEPLARSLFREVSSEFFRVLSSPQCYIYVDVLDALEREASQRNEGVTRDEALAIAEETINTYGHSAIDVEGESSNPAKARLVLDVLLASGWLHEEQRSDWQKLIYFDSNGTLLLQVLRKIARPESVVFSDKIVNVCSTLANHEALADDPWPQIESCISSLEIGLSELRSMQRSIERHTKKQLTTSTMKENLSVLFDQFAQTIGRTCYSQLAYARLPSRLAAARRDLENLESDPELVSKMEAEISRRSRSESLEVTSSHVRIRLDELRDLLHQVEPLADEIDRRTAEFARRSQARFRYLQETTSENRARIQDFFERINSSFAGYRLIEIDSEQLGIPPLILHDIRIPDGIDSLYNPRLHRSNSEIEPLEDVDQRAKDITLAQLAANIRNSLTVSRANRFVESLPGKKNSRMSSSDIVRDYVHNEEDVVHVIACLLNADTTEARYEIHLSRREQNADYGEFDHKLRYRFERFTLVKK